MKNISATEAWRMIAEDNAESAHLIDVRTEAEWHYVGIPDLSSLNRKVILAPLLHYPHMDINPDFVKLVQSQLPKLQAGKKQRLIFLCRVGGRSAKACEIFSEISSEYECYNIQHGFEGDLDKFGHRAKLNGWKHENIPWRQE